MENFDLTDKHLTPVSKAGLISETSAEAIRRQTIRTIDRNSLFDMAKKQQKTLPEVGGFHLIETNEGVIVFADRDKKNDKGYIQKAKSVSEIVRRSGVRARLELLEPGKLDTLKRLSAKDLNWSSSGDQQAYRFYVEILKEAMKKGASDIHIILINDFGNIVYRVNGRLLVDPEPLPASKYIELCNHIYNMRPTGGDGNWQPTKSCNGIDNVEINGELTRWRFHSFPNEDGHHAHIVIRRNNITQPTSYSDVQRWENYSESDFLRECKQLGYLDQHCEQLLRMFTSPDGAVFVSGKTNSGKTTLLNKGLSGAQALNKFERMLICVEDVPELSVPRAVRTPISIDKEHAFSFSDAIKSALRRDADTIVVGEIREIDSGPSVVQAVLSGHLVVASLHTNNLFSMLDRLDHFGVNREFMAGRGNLAGLIWQRLLPTLCDHCKKEVDPDNPSYLRMLARFPNLKDVRVYQQGDGHCRHCHGVPPGRIVAAEMIDFPTAAMRKAILERDEALLAEHWLQPDESLGIPPGITALDHAVHHVRNGVVSPQEIECQLGRFDRVIR